MPPRFTQIAYQLYLPADLHIGSGVGLPGVIDEHVVRDHEDFAFAPFSEIKGIVRDSCVQLMRYLGCDADQRYVCEGHRAMLEASRLGGASPRGFCALMGGKPCALCAIFGSPVTPARWWFSPATYTKDYRKAAKFGGIDSAEEPEARAFAWRDSATSAHAAIDPGTKRAAESQLFNLEIVRLPDEGDPLHQFAIWEGEILELSSGNEAECSDDELLGWLLAALLFTRRIGGRRRRGWGRCRFVLSGDNKQQLETLLGEWLAQLQKAGILKAGGEECNTTK